jgi:tetratricopeptide (TPR) repeat protein
VLKKLVIIRGIIVVTVLLIAGFTASSLMTGCTPTTGTTGTTAKSAMSAAEAAAKAKEDSIALVKYNRDKAIAYSTGHEHHKNKNYKDAIKPLWKAAKMDTAKEWSAVYTKLADCYIQLNKVDSAMIVYEQAIDRYPDNAFFHRSLGYYLNAFSRVPEAIDAYQKAIEYDGDTISDYKTLGPLLVSEDRLEEALEVYQTIVEKDPNDAEAQQTLASIMQGIGMDVMDIIATKEAALEQDPQNVTLAFEIANSYFKEQYYAEAITAFDKVLAINPQDADAWEYKGSAQQNDEKFADAIKSYEKVLELKPDHAKVMCEMATCYLELGNNRRAMSTAQNAINTNSNLGLGYIVKGDVYAKVADDCIGARDKRIAKFDDKLVYEKAYNLYALAAQKDIEYSDLGKRKMNYIKTEVPTKEDRFMHPNQTKPELDCYTWLPW